MRYLLLDWGGVLIEDPAANLVGAIAQRYQCDQGLLGTAISQNLPLVAAGKISEIEMWQQLHDQFHLPLATKDTWSIAVQSVFVFRPKVLNKVRELKERGWQIALLSNTEPSAVDFFRQHECYPLFDYVFVSCEMGHIKPKAEIYELIQNQLGQHEYYFADDKKENLDVPIHLGWNCHWVRTEQDLLEWLSSLDQIS